MSASKILTAWSAAAAMALFASHAGAQDCRFANGVLPPPVPVAQCVADPESCAQVLYDCLKDVDFAASNGWSLWTVGQGLRKLPPGQRTPGDLRHVNHMTPMHGLWLSIFVNEIAGEAIEAAIASGRSIEPVDLPDGSLIVKLNYTDDINTPTDPWMTVMTKIDGYCQPTIGGSCIGGEWFYFLSRFGTFLEFDGTPVYGKPQAFCTDCHNPVQNSDFLWTLNAALKANGPFLTSDGQSPTPPFESRDQALCAPEVTMLSPDLPPDVAFDPGMLSPAEAQRMFDCLSWRSFISLNWSADPRERGQPNKATFFSETTAPRVWETYKETFEVFQPTDPSWTLDDKNWNDAPALPAACRQTLAQRDPADRMKVLQMVTKTRANQVLNETHQAMGNQFNILIDQDGRLVRYEVRLNQDEFEYLKANRFANTGNYSFSGPVGLPPSERVSFPTNQNGTTGAGAIEVKAAWRELCGEQCTAEEERTAERYYTSPALVFTPATEGEAAQCRIAAKVGLIGLHVIRKTFWAPQWVWSTFEHVDNVPPADGPPDPGTSYTLFNPVCTDPQSAPTPAMCATQRPGVFPQALKQKAIKNGACCPNLQLIENAHPSFVKRAIRKLLVADGKPPTANQVTRLDPIGPVALNTLFLQKIVEQNAANPFRYYRLVNTQWPNQARDPETWQVKILSCAQRDAVRLPAGTPCYTIVPRKGDDSLRLRNTTMETFQVSTDWPADPTPFSSAGCINCHGESGVDFSFVFLDAEEISSPIVKPR